MCKELATFMIASRTANIEKLKKSIKDGIDLESLVEPMPTIFIQCGVNKPEGQCSSVYINSRPNPLDAIRDKLVNSIRGSNEKAVKDIVYRTFEDFDSTTQVSGYINGFKLLAPQVIGSRKAGSWIVEPLNASCGVTQ